MKANTLEMSAGRNEKVALFRKLATWDNGGLLSSRVAPSYQLEGRGFHRQKSGNLRAVQAGAMGRTAVSSNNHLKTGCAMFGSASS